MARTAYGSWGPAPAKCEGPACAPRQYGPTAPRALRSRHCDCRKLGLLKAECQMPDSGVCDEEMIEAYTTTPPEGRGRSAKHAYVLCIAMVRDTEDNDW